MSTILSGRTHHRRVEVARYAPRTFSGQFALAVSFPTAHPDADVWQARFGRALHTRPVKLRQQWLTFAELLWPETRLSLIPYQESALKTEKAVELWQAGERDLEALAHAVNQAIPA